MFVCLFGWLRSLFCFAFCFIVVCVDCVFACLFARSSVCVFFLLVLWCVVFVSCVCFVCVLLVICVFVRLVVCVID